MKKANVRVFWTPSVSADVKKVVVETTINGNKTSAEFGPEVNDFVVEIEASSTVVVDITVTDSEGLTASAETYTFTLGDLEAPQPVTNIGHEIVGIFEV